MFSVTEADLLVVLETVTVRLPDVDLEFDAEADGEAMTVCEKVLVSLAEGVGPERLCVSVTVPEGLTEADGVGPDGETEAEALITNVPEGDALSVCEAVCEVVAEIEIVSETDCVIVAVMVSVSVRLQVRRTPAGAAPPRRFAMNSPVGASGPPPSLLNLFRHIHTPFGDVVAHPPICMNATVGCEAVASQFSCRRNRLCGKRSV